MIIAMLSQLQANIIYSLQRAQQSFKSLVQIHEKSGIFQLNFIKTQSFFSADYLLFSFFKLVMLRNGHGGLYKAPTKDLVNKINSFCINLQVYVPDIGRQK